MKNRKEKRQISKEKDNERIRRITRKREANGRSNMRVRGMKRLKVKVK